MDKEKKQGRVKGIGSAGMGVNDNFKLSDQGRLPTLKGGNGY